MNPRTGARVVLELEGLEEPSGLAVVYRVTVWLPDRRLGGEARVDPLGEVGFTGWDPEPPSEKTLAFTHAVLRAMWRERARGDATPWPRRISRWRDPDARGPA